MTYFLVRNISFYKKKNSNTYAYDNVCCPVPVAGLPAPRTMLYARPYISQNDKPGNYCAGNWGGNVAPSRRGMVCSVSNTNRQTDRGCVSASVFSFYKTATLKVGLPPPFRPGIRFCKERMIILVQVYLLIMSSGVTIEEVYSEIKKIRAEMVRREDVEALIDTVEILSTPETLQLIRKSEEDIAHGRVKEISSVDDLLCELS